MPPLRSVVDITVQALTKNSQDTQHRRKVCIIYTEIGTDQIVVSLWVVYHSRFTLDPDGCPATGSQQATDRNLSGYFNPESGKENV